MRHGEFGRRAKAVCTLLIARDPVALLNSLRAASACNPPRPEGSCTRCPRQEVAMRLDDTPTPSWLERLAVVAFVAVVALVTLLGLIIAIT
jgi:hypothetical protein